MFAVCRLYPIPASIHFSALEMMYQCVMEALQGQCGQSVSNNTYIDAAYDMMRVYERDLPACAGVKDSSASQLTNSCLILVLLLLSILQKAVL